jgi:hypothetical protein
VKTSFLSKEILESTRLISRERSVNRFKKLDFTAQGIMESLSEFGLCISLFQISAECSELEFLKRLWGLGTEVE